MAWPKLFLAACVARWFLQPAMAPPPGAEFPWWGCRIWEDKAYMCSPEGWCRQLSWEEEDQLKHYVNTFEHVEEYIYGHSQLCEASNGWAVPEERPFWNWETNQYQHPGFTRNRPARSPSIRRPRSPSRGPRRPKEEPARASGSRSAPRRQEAAGATKREPADRQPARADPFQHMFRGHGSKIKRAARRALQQAGCEVPNALKPGKAIEDLPRERQNEARSLQRLLKELRYSEKPLRVVQQEVEKTKARLHHLLHDEPSDEGDEEEFCEEADEEETQEHDADYDEWIRKSKADNQEVDYGRSSSECNQPPGYAKPVRAAAEPESKPAEAEKKTCKEEEKKDKGQASTAPEPKPADAQKDKGQASTAPEPEPAKAEKDKGEASTVPDQKPAEATEKPKAASKSAAKAPADTERKAVKEEPGKAENESKTNKIQKKSQDPPPVKAEPEKATGSAPSAPSAPASAPPAEAEAEVNPQKKKRRRRKRDPEDEDKETDDQEGKEKKDRAAEEPK